MFAALDSRRNSFGMHAALTWERKLGTVANFVAASSSLHRIVLANSGIQVSMLASVQLILSSSSNDMKPLMLLPIK